MESAILKKQAAQAALPFIEPGMILGIGTGTTVDYFIDALQPLKNKIEAVVASSLRTAQKLKALSLPVVDANTVGSVQLYVDSADEVNNYRQMLKGGGGALTGEKIIAAMATQFICIVDFSKQVDLLGHYPVAVEVIPAARSYCARQLVKLGGDPIYRQGYVTDNGNVIVDVYNLKITNPLALEQQINNIAGVISNGIFAQRPADKVLVATPDGIKIF